MTDLRRQYQAFRHLPESGIMGDCYRTALACVLNVPRDSVPHSHEDLSPDEHTAFVEEWLRSQGLTRIFFPVAPHPGAGVKEVATAYRKYAPDLPLILTALGPRDANHVVVFHTDGVCWCPTLGVLNAEQLLQLHPAAPDGYYWVEFIVRAP